MGPAVEEVVGGFRLPGRAGHCAARRCRSHSLLTLASENPTGPVGPVSILILGPLGRPCGGGGAEAPLRRPVREPGLPSVLQQGGRLLFGGEPGDRWGGARARQVLG